MLHLNVVAVLPEIPGVLHFDEGDRSYSAVYFALVKRTEHNPGVRSQDSTIVTLSAAMNFEHGDGDEDYLPNGNESYLTNHRHLQDLQRLSALQQVTTEVPPSYDGINWFAYEDAIDDWCDITELDGDKRGPALRNRLEGEATIHTRLLDRDRLKDPNNGVKYFNSFLRPLFVKGAANVLLYRFQQFMSLHRGNGDMLRWITRFQLSVQRMQEAWNDTFRPITDPTMQRSEPLLQDYRQKNKQTLLTKMRWTEPTNGFEISMHGPFRSRPTLWPSSLCPCPTSLGISGTC